MLVYVFPHLIGADPPAEELELAVLATAAPPAPPTQLLAADSAVDGPFVDAGVRSLEHAANPKAVAPIARNTRPYREEIMADPNTPIQGPLEDEFLAVSVGRFVANR